MFWDNFVSLCANVGKSPNAIADELKIPSGSITAWKKGAVPRPATVKKIAAYFEVSIDSILSEGKEKSPILSDEASEIDIQILNALKELSEEQKAQALDFALFLANNSKK